MAAVQKLVKLFYNKSGQIDAEQLNLACNFLRNRGVIALPTDTLYGIAARVEDSDALERIYRIKGRSRDKPLSVCVSNIEQINEIADTSKVNKLILSSLFPGPITIVLKRAENLNKSLNPGIETIGVRIPDHNFIKALSHMVGPLALTSANRSGESNPLIINDFEDLWDELDCVFDCGLLQHYLEDGDPTRTQRLGSTVIDLSQKNEFRVIREGCSLHRTVGIIKRFGYKHLKNK